MSLLIRSVDIGVCLMLARIAHEYAYDAPVRPMRPWLSALAIEVCLLSIAVYLLLTGCRT